MKIKFLIFILIFTVSGLTQNINSLESDFEKTGQKLRAQNSVLDSLQAVIQKLTGEIEAEKSESAPDQAILKRKMAQVLTLGSQIEEQQAAIEKIKNRRNTIGRKLDARYSALIDSLKALQPVGETESRQRDTEAKIIDYTKKRLAVFPALKGLTFNPQRLQQIHISQSQDSVERAIYLDYLKNARADVQRHLDKITRVRRELEDIESLQEKLDEFVTEVDENRTFEVFARSSSPAAAGEVRSEAQNTFTGQSAAIALKSQVQSLLFFVNELNAGDSRITQTLYESPIDSSSVILSNRQYIELLEKAEGWLKDYDMVIEKKMAGED